MSWWNRDTTTPTPYVVEDPKKSLARTYSIPADALVNHPNSFAEALAQASPEKIKDPEPDLSTKPKDFWEFRLGLACQKNKHRGAVDERGDLGAPGLAKVNPIICSHCGSMIVYAVFRILKTHLWRDFWAGYHTVKSVWGWEPFPKNWGDWKFVHYLDTPGRGKKK